MLTVPRRNPVFVIGAVLMLAVELGGCNAGDATKASHSSANVVAAPPAGVNSSTYGATPPGATSPKTPFPVTTPVAPAGAPCGYNASGTSLHIADQIDVCLPAVVCTSETCPPPLGDCVAGKCVYKTGYQGLATLPQSWATYYCQLSSGGCNGVSQVEPPLTTATKVGALFKLPLCEGNTAGGTCVGIAASSAMLVGNSQVAMDPTTGAYVKPWGLGLTEASGLCYKLNGPGGEAIVALTDRCGGYCKCNGSNFQECGPCVSAASMVPNCPCVGTAPPLYPNCCGSTCPNLVPACDWCATNNHPHFDLDTATFNTICGANAAQGSCQLKAVAPVACATGVTWPPL